MVDVQFKSWASWTVVTVLAAVFVGPQLVRGEEGPTTEIYINLREAPRIVGRSEWTGRPASCHVESCSEPAHLVVIHSTMGPACQTQPQCSLYVKRVQERHMREFGWCDIGYNFLVGGDGNVYEGRAWHKDGPHDDTHNGTLHIAFIGTFTDDLPDDYQMTAYWRLINVGVSTGAISKDYRVEGHGEHYDSVLLRDIQSHVDSSTY